MEKMQSLLSDVTMYILPLNSKTIILGVNKTNKQMSYCTMILYNFILYISKWCIWKHRNNVKHGNHNVKNCDTIFSDILNCIHRMLGCYCKAKILLLKMKFKDDLKYILILGSIIYTCLVEIYN